MKPHRPDVVIRLLAHGYAAACLNCREHSTPSFHKPIAEQWRREHVKAALNAPVPRRDQ